jgi:hypothetical protein
MAKDALGHGSDTRGLNARTPDSANVPLRGHANHLKSNDELRGIVKDAGAAAENFRNTGMMVPGTNVLTENKYMDQMHDANTVLGYRARGGRDFSQTADASAARTLGGHPKSAAVGLHPSMTDKAEAAHFAAMAERQSGHPAKWRP